MVEILLEGTLETLYMTFASTLLAYLIGMPLGILVTITDEKGIMPNKIINGVIGCGINIIRSIPFIILLIALIPLTKLIVGKSIGSTAAIVPLVIGAAPFVARMIESSLHEVDNTLIESAIAMGCNKREVIFKVMIPEVIPSIVRGLSITLITLIGYSAMAGAVGGGGLGDIAIRYGYYRYQYDTMMLTIFILIIMVQLIQFTCNYIAKKIDKKVR
ncbi:MAG: methionine ABC transporter permease [Epulopiscium sp. Nele67-Bin001]|nr:MAG: methionine ABC transporter permease [Epulopiscium sp. Nuni2H_MBin001]OON92351.1 MAG: methionine ABC transporter permease [Epulopiscium sp. Nele67-Bin001]